jgi:hypothetical protein
MEGFIILAASTFREQVKAATHGERFGSRDALTALTVGLAVGFIVVVWIYFHYRKKRERQDKERLGRKIVSSVPSTSVASSDSDPEAGERRRIRKRRRRRAHRPRNPSLHQTGGLPPQRPDDDLPKF